ncbi:trypsin-like peptidase domain-containing protein [Nonomuraea sp. B19D2]|uniref:trypsin-like peptidase domain-containing protein n=1 Tax=Nonomuraea sp. B19D2 TaxID=3159561 RepID=UPI0032DB3947
MIEKKGNVSWARLPALGAVLIVLTTAAGCAQWFRNADESHRPAPVGEATRPTPQMSDPSRVNAQVAASRSNVVKLIGNAPSCNNTRPEGTGFAYEPERVMTTAHLVAGTAGPITVIGPDGKRYKGRVVLFDPSRDVAVLRVPSLRARSLVFGPIKAGESAIVAGYSKGEDLTVTSGKVSRGTIAHGPDIYHERQIRREVHIVHAPVKAGVPGGPLLRSDGTVSGMVFASDIRKPSGYALSAAEIIRSAMDGTAATATVSTQGCD